MPLSPDGPIATHLAGVPERERAALAAIVDRVLETVPDVGEKVSYGLPTLTYRGKALLSAVAAKTRHMPDDFLTAEGTGLTEKGMAYMKRLVPKKYEVAKPFV